MITFGSEIIVSSPPADVWPYLVEHDKQALWSDVPMELLTERPLRAGSRMRLTLGSGPLRTSLTLEITALEPHERMTFTTVSQGGIRWDGEYRLSPEGAGARLSQQGTIRFSGLWRLAEPLVGAEIKRGELAELEKLKQILEGTRA